MEKMLYLNPVGRDQWIHLSLRSKEIELLDIQTEQVEKIPFLTKKDAEDNFRCWLDNAESRLPKTFVINTREELNLTITCLTRLNLYVPPTSELSDYLIYEKHNDQYYCYIVNCFDNKLLPVMDIKNLERLSNSNLLDQVEFMSTEKIMSSLTNEERKKLCTLLLNSEDSTSVDGEAYKGPAVSFIFFECDKFIAVDNRTHDCWIEQFNTYDDALAWALDIEGDPS